MGCDIHLYREKHVDGQWRAADEWVPSGYGDDHEVLYDKRAFTGRNYRLFGLLAKGVREEYPFSFIERGMPFDASPEVAAEAAAWDCDGHSHSYLYLHELQAMDAYLDMTTVKVCGMKDGQQLTALRESIASGSPEWDLLWPFCQRTNIENYESFELDVPASVVIGDSLKTIIDSFEGIDGDNHRIVFFFDN